jgi:hypothetical protein
MIMILWRRIHSNGKVEATESRKEKNNNKDKI